MATTRASFAKCVHNVTTLKKRKTSTTPERRRWLSSFRYHPRRLSNSGTSRFRRLRVPRRASRRLLRVLGRSRRRPAALLASSRCASSDSFSRSVVAHARFSVSPWRSRPQRTTRRFRRTARGRRRSPRRQTAPFARRAFVSRVSSAARRFRLSPRWQLRWQASILKSWHFLKRCRASLRCRG